MSCRTALISVGLSWAVGMVLLVLLLEGVGVGVVEAVEAPPFMLRSVGPVEREREGEVEWNLCMAPRRCCRPFLSSGPAVGHTLRPEALVYLDSCALVPRMRPGAAQRHGVAITFRVVLQGRETCCHHVTWEKRGLVVKRFSQDHTDTRLCIRSRVTCGTGMGLAPGEGQGSLAPITPLLLSEDRQVDAVPSTGTRPGSGLQVRGGLRAKELPTPQRDGRSFDGSRRRHSPNRAPSAEVVVGMLRAGGQRGECAVPGVRSGAAEDQGDTHPCARAHTPVRSGSWGLLSSWREAGKASCPARLWGQLQEGLGTLSLALRGHGTLDPADPPPPPIPQPLGRSVLL